LPILPVGEEDGRWPLKLMADALVERNADWFAEVLDAMDDLVLVKGPSSRLLWANRAFREYYGLDNETLRSIIDGPQSDPDDTLQYVRDDRRVFVERRCIDVPCEPVTRHDGETGLFHTVKCPIYENGEVVRQVGVSRAHVDPEQQDRWAHRRELARRSTHEVRALVYSLPSPVVMLDAAHRVIMWNDAFGEIVERQGSCGDELLHADYAETLNDWLPILDELESALHGHTPGTRRVEIGVGTDSPRLYNVDCRAWIDTSGAAGGTLAVLSDVTTLVATERRLLESNEELAQFNYRVSHDIVAPISTARGFLALANEVLEDGDREEVPKLLGVVEHQLSALTALVSDLAELARAGMDERKAETVSLRKMVSTIEADHTAERPSAALSVVTELGLAEVRTDPVRIRQMLSNLIGNAIKFRDPSEEEVRVVVTSRREGDTSVIEVSDNGVGVPLEFEARAFEMFTRGSTGVAGTGLGLYIAKKHADRLGGTLSIAHRAKPTVFRISLPGASGAAS